MPGSFENIGPTLHAMLKSYFHSFKHCSLALYSDCKAVTWARFLPASCFGHNTFTFEGLYILVHYCYSRLWTLLLQVQNVKMACQISEKCKITKIGSLGTFFLFITNNNPILSLKIIIRHISLMFLMKTVFLKCI